MKQLGFLMLLLVFVSCKQATKATRSTTVQDILYSNAEPIDAINRSLNTGTFHEFTLIKGDIKLQLRAWRSTINLTALGKPIDTSSHILGEGADTHNGSVVKKYRYKNSWLQFFGPPNGKDVWLLQMEVTGNDWRTARGVRVGDGLNKLKELYPEATNQYSGEKRIYRYSESESVMEFTFKGETISMIQLRYEIP